VSRVHIFGLDHFHQNLEARCLTPAGIADEREQKIKLADTLREIVIKNGVGLIAEEGRLERPCLGYILAKELKVGHIDITMPVEERKKQGIKTPEYDFQESTRKAAYAIFEQYMFDQIKARDVGVILIMCGHRHFRALKRLFEAAGDEVCLYDINDYAWYRGIPKEGAEGVIGYERES